MPLENVVTGSPKVGRVSSPAEVFDFDPIPRLVERDGIDILN